MEQKYILTHAGIKGMRWGVRRYQNPDGTLTDAGRKRYGYGDDSDDHKTSRENVRKRTEALSTKELKALNERLQAEKQYKELTARKETAFEKAAKEVLTNVGKNLAQNYLQKFATKGIDALIGKFTGVNANGTADAAKSIFDKGKAEAKKAAASFEKKNQQRSTDNEKARKQKAAEAEKAQKEAEKRADNQDSDTEFHFTGADAYRPKREYSNNTSGTSRLLLPSNSGSRSLVPFSTNANRQLLLEKKRRRD